jgi:hypothetical protein
MLLFEVGLFRDVGLHVVSPNLQIGANRKGIITTGFELVVLSFQKAAQGFPDQSATEGGFDRQFPHAKAPGKLPLILTGIDLTFNLTTVPTMARNPDMGGGLGEFLLGHGSRNDR